MKKLAVLSVVLVTLMSCGMNNQQNADLAARIQLLEDRAAIKNVVDTFSVLADVKDVDTQVLLFTEDAEVKGVDNDGNVQSVIKGRKDIANAFSSYLALFETVYHQNGQQTVTINGDKADGINYCYVTLIRVQDGKRIKQTMGVRYHDFFTKEDGKWLIYERQSNFMWTTFDEIQ